MYTLVVTQLVGQVLFQKRFEGLADVNTCWPNFAGLVEYLILCKWWYCTPFICNSHSKPPYKFIFTFCKLCLDHDHSSPLGGNPTASTAGLPIASLGEPGTNNHATLVARFY